MKRLDHTNFLKALDAHRQPWFEKYYAMYTSLLDGVVTDPALMLLVWVLGGAITLCGALSIAELAGALPQTGGLYAYLREGWGRPAAFLFGWAQLTLIRASALGAIAKDL